MSAERTQQRGLDRRLVALAGFLVSCYGGGFSTMPAVAADFYGTANARAVDGAMIVAWSIGGVVGPLGIAGIHSLADSFVPALYLFAVIALASLLIPGAIKKPGAPQAARDRAGGEPAPEAG